MYIIIITNLCFVKHKCSVFVIKIHTLKTPGVPSLVLDLWDFLLGGGVFFFLFLGKLLSGGWLGESGWRGAYTSPSRWRTPLRIMRAHLIFFP